MMNIVALCVVVTSLAAAGVLSPTPSPTTNTDKKINHQHEEDSLLVSKEGLRVIVVEYEKQGTGTGIGKTKVSISPPQPQEDHDSAVTAAVEKKNKIHNVEIEDGTRIGGKVEEEDPPPSSSNYNARQLICDAFGKCNNKIVGAFGKAKEKVEEEAKEAVEVVSRKAHEMEECHEEASNKTRKTLKTAFDTGKTLEGDVRRNVSEDLDIVRRHVANKAKKGIETAETAAEKVKDVVKDKARGGLETVETATEKAKEGLESAETAAEKLKDKVKGRAKGGLETAETKAKRVKDRVKDTANKIEHQIRRVRDFARDVLMYVVAAVSSSIGSLLEVVHLLGFAMAYGMSVWITFVSSYVLATALPRQQFCMVQTKIYPLYFRAMAYSLGVALLGHLLSQRTNAFDSKAEIFQGYNLIASLLMVFANLLYLEPRATKVMFERMKVEKEEGRGGGGGRDVSSFRSEPTGSRTSGNAAAAPTTNTNTNTTEQEAARAQIVGLNERLRKLNSFSSTLNILTLMSLTWHLVYLGQRLHMSSCH